MKTKVVATPAAFLPVQIEGFPEDCERTRKGALHLRPATVENLSEGEVAHIKEKYPDVHRLLAISDQPAAREPKTAAPSGGAPGDEPTSGKSGKRGKGGKGGTSS